MVRIHRPPHADLPHSPSVVLYGRHQGRLLAPLDLVVMRVEAGEPVYDPPVDPGRLRGAPVRDEGGGLVGTVEAYGWPPALPTRVDPVVRIETGSDPPASVPRGAAPEPDVSMGDPVVLFDEEDEGEDRGGEDGDGDVPGATVSGTVGGLLQPRPYPDPGHRADTYRVTFSRHLHADHHGARVHLSDGRLLGMLVATENDGDGACRALVYPAHRV